jgi:hypothetical protein
MTWWDPFRLTITSWRVAVSLPSIASPPLALAALVLPGVGGGGVGSQHECNCAYGGAQRHFHRVLPLVRLRL